MERRQGDMDRRAAERRRDAAADAMAAIRVDHYRGAERRREERREAMRRAIDNARVAKWMETYQAARELGA